MTESDPLSHALLKRDSSVVDWQHQLHVRVCLLLADSNQSEIATLSQTDEIAKIETTARETLEDLQMCIHACNRIG